MANSDKRAEVPALHRLIQLLLGLQVLLLVPGGLTEVINFPRAFLLAVFGCISIYFLAPFIKETFQSRSIFFIGVFYLFFLNIWCVVMLSGADVLDQLIGERGRNTGALTYSSLILIALLVYFTNTKQFANSIVNLGSILGFVMCLYALLQYFKLDPIPWDNQAGWIIGTFGNPNFLSSYLGITFTLVLGKVFDNTVTLKSFNLRNILWLLLLPFLLLIILLTDSKQGLLIAIVGIVSFIFLKLIVRRILKEILASVFLISISGFLGLLGVFNKGPLAQFLYEDSVTYRGDYWRAGIDMGIDQPWFGVGIDQYGANYRSYRDLTTALRRGGEVTSNSAHNVFLDLFSGGGFPLLISYSLVILLTLFFGFRSLQRLSAFDPIKTSIFSALIAYLVQSIISINQIGLAFLGWLLLGVVASWSREHNDVELGKSSTAFKRTSAIVTITLSIFAITPLMKYASFDSRFNSLVKSGDIQGVIELVSKEDVDGYYRNLSAASISGEEAGPIKEKLLRLSIKVNPQDYTALELLKKLLTDRGDKVEAEEIRRKQLELDPFNPGLQTPIK